MLDFLYQHYSLVVNWALAIPFLIFLIYLWIKKNFKKEYFYLILCIFIYIPNAYLLEFGHLYLEKTLDAIGVYFFAFSGIIPILRYLSHSTEKIEEDLFLKLRIYFNLISLIFIVIITNLAALSYSLKNLYIVEFVNLAVFFYSMSILLIVFKILYRIRELNLAFVLKSWLTYLFIMGTMELIGFFGINFHILNIAIYSLLILLFVFNRRAKHNILR